MLKSFNQAGSAAAVAVIVLLSVGLVGAAAFGYWAFDQRQTYKNKTGEITAKAVSAAEEAQAAKLKAQFEQQEKNPFKTFKGSATHGTVTFEYPKTWSAYVDESTGSTLLNGYFHPGQVPGTQSKTAYALRVELVSEPYESVLNRYDSQIKNGDLTAAAFMPNKLKGVANVQPGVKLNGAIATDRRGAAVIIKVRDKTLKISTESPNFLSDFNNTILPSLSFSP